MRIADILTASRVIASPVIVWLILSDELSSAYYIFAAAAITDLLDGYFARRSKKIVSYGATFDGLADFALIFPTMFAIAINGEGFWLLAVALIAIVFLIPVLGFISKKREGLTIPHLDTNLLAAFVYPTIMVHIINWQYAELLLIFTFLVLLYYASKYIAFLRSIDKKTTL
jgi:phosphatidylglycerophosphate synthase